MCGFGGYVGRGSKPILEEMVARLAHRGPDGKGVWRRDGVGLAHTRLSILDLTPAGSQPMVSTDGRWALVYNGEIYNYRELRHELQQEGEIFRSASDTEVLLHGYRKWGARVVEKLRGMFAFGIWDDARRGLFLARDRLGIKPLFYAPLSDGLVFGSEIKSVLAHPGLRPRMNPGAVDAYFELGYIPGPDTIFEGVHMLAPGCWLEYRSGDIQSQRYWRPEFQAEPHKRNEAELADELDQRLHDAVSRHLVADVPVGAFLSGGIDSSLVCAVAQRHSAEPIQTFTIGFDGGDDERVFARSVAAHIGSDHREQIITADIVQELPQLLRSLEQPLFDNSALPTYLVSQLARRHVKVVLSGDGGDEPFGGYEWTRLALSLPGVKLDWQPEGWQWAYQQGPAGLAKRLIYDVTHASRDRYQRRVSVSDSMRRWLYHPAFRAEIVERGRSYNQGALERLAVQDERDALLCVDLCRYLPEDVLFKVDRMSMAHGLEVRVPLLDQLLLEWVLHLPFDMRFRAGRGKYLLRKLASRYLPAAVLKPRKQGFTVPLGRWLLGPLGNWAEELFRSASFDRRRIVRPQAALEMLAMHRSRRYDLGHRIWSLVIFEIWARMWIDRREDDGLMEECRLPMRRRDTASSFGVQSLMH
jgi:asparagine synthase (glutamine-hydrolysing)